MAGEDDAVEADELGDGPGLKGAAAGTVRGLGVGDFAHVAKARVVQVLEEGRDETLASFCHDFGRHAADFHPGFDEGAEQPGPDGALVVGTVALAHAATVIRDVGGMAALERAQADGGPELALDGVDDLSGALGGAQGER